MVRGGKPPSRVITSGQSIGNLKTSRKGQRSQICARPLLSLCYASATLSWHLTEGCSQKVGTVCHTDSA